MKITVDLVAAQQEWNPDTGEQVNCLVMRYAGREYSFVVTEEELAAAVRAIRSGVDPHDEEEYMGPEVVVPPPSAPTPTFRPIEDVAPMEEVHTAPPSQQRRLEHLRARAKAPPRPAASPAAADEDGFGQA